MKQSFMSLLSIGLVILSACSQPQKNVTIYGSITCDHCIDFMSNLDEASIGYSFKDVEANATNMEELKLLINKLNYKGYVGYPVVLVGEELLVSPEMDQFQTLLNKP